MNATTNESYNEKFLSIKSGCYNEQRCYNKRGEILFIMESSVIFCTIERLFMLFIKKGLLIGFTNERLFMLFLDVRLFMLLLGKVCS
jgi:hypothetical protein